MVIAILDIPIARQVKEWYGHMGIEQIDYVNLDLLEQTELPL